MKSGGVSLEFYMILCDWTLVLLKDIKNIDIIQAERHQGYYHRSYQIGWRSSLILYLHMIQIYSSPRYSVNRCTNTNWLGGNKAIPPRLSNVNRLYLTVLLCGEVYYT